MRLAVRYSRRAVKDREVAYEWFVANYSSEYARRWLKGITEAIESLDHAPDRYPKAAESNQFSFDVFEMLFGPKRNKHRILFEIADDKVTILHIRHSARRDLQPDDILPGI
jgi:plasmid stabilization system protein ParE